MNLSSDTGIRSDRSKTGSHWIFFGRYWVLKCLLVVMLSFFVFGTPFAVFRSMDYEGMPPAYAAKSLNPWEDTAKASIQLACDHPGERSHGAKLTPRILPSLFLFASRTLNLHSYLPASLGGVMLLLSGLLVGNSIFGDRATAFGVSLIYSGLFAASACFSAFGVKPFDGVVVGILSLATLLTNRPYLFGIVAFLALWADERALVSLLIIGAMIWALRVDRSKCSPSVVALFMLAPAYAVTRLLLSHVLGWSGSDGSFLGIGILGKMLQAPQWMLWVPLEGGLLLLAIAIWLLFKHDTKMQCLLFMGMLVGVFASLFVAIDLSRSAVYLFPLIPTSLAILKRHAFPDSTTRTVVYVSAFVCLLCPSLSVAPDWGKVDLGFQPSELVLVVKGSIEASGFFVRGLL